MLEAISSFEELSGKRMQTGYVAEPRRGDHICYISDLRRFRSDYRDWHVTMTLEAVLAELAGARAAEPIR